ncbi:50S ribosomal protein L4 [Coxiella endosymbiont of Amblyomma americanum]|uniref:50S ribosomal protein L4 n=1 Tax=Coxiella endosymbiont of Amblyomma americanum TaxID=325775 RepID=UPI00057D9462|nr:50S ribosomal protein L4 [Coxiella endosymbiont of Amblyomma americanum]AJC50424.1 50S ribosomal protein L4 [Coxiella endosymbiont of Amblyomma americanum]AUJ58764.1 50S ribosomal protein L4 [Coxiella-like endosymbiont of Amblyomma americanum]
MDLSVYSSERKEVNRICVSDAIFGAEFKESLVHQVVTAYLAGARAGTKAQKTRGKVRGGGTKPWRQKGTGRARVGSIRSPLWRGGGVTFAAAPRDFSQKVNRKMYRRSMVSIFSELIRQNRFVVIETLQLQEPKTRELLQKVLLKKSDVKKVLIVLDEYNRNVELAARNVRGITTLNVMRMDPISLIAAEEVLITVGAVKNIESRLQIL